MLRLGKIILFNWIIALFLWLINCGLSYAQPANDLYQIDIKLDTPINYSKDYLANVFLLGIKSVLIKVTGNINITERLNNQPSEFNPKRYLTSYSYIAKYDSSGQSISYLHQQYNPAAINQLIKQLYGPIWYHHRPVLFLDINDHQLSAKLSAQLLALAKFRGISISFASPSPLPTEQIAFLLTGQIDDQTNHSQWQLTSLHPTSTPIAEWSQQVMDLADNLTDNFNQAVDLIAQQYTIYPHVLKNSKPILLYVYGVNNLADYLLVNNYLKKIPAINNFKVTKITQNSLNIMLQLTANPTILQKILELDKLNNQPINYKLAEIEQLEANG